MPVKAKAKARRPTWATRLGELGAFLSKPYCWIIWLCISESRMVRIAVIQPARLCTEIDGSTARIGKRQNAAAIKLPRSTVLILLQESKNPTLLLDPRRRGAVLSLPSNMKVIAAYLLAVLGGNTAPSAADIKDILGSVGVDPDDDRIELLLSEVKGKDITDLIASGREKFASVPSGGGGAIAVAAPAGGAAAAAAPAAEAKKEEKVEEKEESDDDMGFGLFD